MEQQTATSPTAQRRRDYSTAFVVEQAPAEVYTAIVDVRAWWTGEHEGAADTLGAEFSYRHPPQHYSLQRVVALDFARRVVWNVIESELSFVSEPAEWTGSTIRFEIAPVEAGTELRFTHVGLVPDVECYEACSTAWLHYIDGSLRSLITTGAGLPDPW